LSRNGLFNDPFNDPFNDIHKHTKGDFHALTSAAFSWRADSGHHPDRVVLPLIDGLIDADTAPPPGALP
jgi:hypothetical protein